MRFVSPHRASLPTPVGPNAASPSRRSGAPFVSQVRLHVLDGRGSHAGFVGPTWYYVEGIGFVWMLTTRKRV